MSEGLLEPETYCDILVSYVKADPERLQALNNGRPLIVTESELAKSNIRLTGALDRGDATILPGAELARQELSRLAGRELPPIIITRVTRQLSALRSRDLGRLVTVSGLVKLATEPMPHFTKTSWQCKRCGAITEVMQQGLRKLSEPIICDREQGGCGRTSTAFNRVHTPLLRAGENAGWYYPEPPIDERWLEIQEPPGSKEAADRPSSRLVRALGDRYADVIMHAGDVVTVTGVLLPDDEENKKLAPMTFIDAHHIDIESSGNIEITPDDFAFIKKVAGSADPLAEYIVPSIAPHVVGRDEPKMALACSLFSGYNWDQGRETIHTLLVGDPSTAKSQMARHACAIAPRGLFVSAKASTEAGLTAVADRDPAQGGRWTLIAGALTLADMGVCGIDEVGELKPTAWKALEETMEEGTHSPAKAGITSRFNSRTVIIACGNPVGGSKWDDSKGTTLHEKMGDMPASTLGRFDFVFIIKDDPKLDEEMMDAMARRRGHGPPIPDPPLTVQQFRAYIMHARHIRPQLTDEADAIFRESFRKIRSVPAITGRTFESYMRIGQALARMRLSPTVTTEDAKRAVGVHHAGWAPVIEDYASRGGDPTLSQKEKMAVVLDVIDGMSKEDGNADLNTINTRSRERGVPAGDIMSCIERLCKDGRVSEVRHGYYKVV